MNTKRVLVGNNIYEMAECFGAPFGFYMGQADGALPVLLWCEATGEVRRFANVMSQETYDWIRTQVAASAERVIGAMGGTNE